MLGHLNKMIHSSSSSSSYTLFDDSEPSNVANTGPAKGTHLSRAQNVYLYLHTYTHILVWLQNHLRALRLPKPKTINKPAGRPPGLSAWTSTNGLRRRLRGAIKAGQVTAGHVIATLRRAFRSSLHYVQCSCSCCCRVLVRLLSTAWVYPILFAIKASQR